MGVISSTWPVDQLDLAVDDELRGADVDVVARAATQVLHEQPGIVVAEVEPETGFRQPCIEIGVVLADLVVDRLLELIQDLVGQRGEDQISFRRRHAAADGALRIEIGYGFHQRIRAHDMGGRALHHGHVDAGLV